MRNAGASESGGVVSTDEQYNLIGSADVEAAAGAVAVAEYPEPISYCSRNHALVEDEKS